MAGVELTAEIRVDTARLDALSEGLQAQLRDVVEVAAFSIERRAKSVPPPIDTGATMNSIHVTMSDGGGDYAAARSAAASLRPGVQQFPENIPSDPGGGIAANIGPSTAYAYLLEFGTHNMPARPFMIPSLEAERGPLLAAIEYIFTKAANG